LINRCRRILESQPSSVLQSLKQTLEGSKGLRTRRPDLTISAVPWPGWRTSLNLLKPV